MRSVVLFVLSLFVSATAMADTIAGMNATDRDYTIEGDVVTVWTDSFLLNDGTAQVIVDIRPHTTSELHLAGRDYVQVSGRMADEVFKPLVLAQPNGTNTMFTGTVMLDPLPLTDVMRNTERHRFAPPPKSEHTADDKSEEQSAPPADSAQ